MPTAVVAAHAAIRATANAADSATPQVEATTSAESAPVACHVCRSEIPLSTALTPEGEQYVEHYCGLDCYETWFHRRCEDEYPAASDYGRTRNGTT